ncbi:hypothetical protein POM88_004514 [Heracleum sosnowskyi]|uniref:Replication factor A C-terminal domain-containing protein n=1 Tax=Heracleum sosnowskyi TaxID=360622 RepID=A0AAD8JK04_9APIA|nr:hypothetical protein POM88_004514 [Heracleum sosnowskyi]
MSTFVDGENYEICNFTVAPYTEKYKCFESDIQIVLTNLTVVTPDEENYSVIPDNIFHFTNLKHFVDATEEDNHLIDIVGIVDDIKPMKYVTNIRNGDQYFMEFVVTDLMHRVTVFFWNELASSFQNAFNQAADEPVIIVISCCRMICNNYNGVMTIKNMPATTFDMNVNCEQVDTLRNRTFDQDLQEGQIYDLTNFIVQEYTGLESHRCVRYEKHIYFADYTKLEKSTNDGLNIPNYSFDIFSLKDLESMEGNKRFLCDVVGVIKDVMHLRDYVSESNEDKKQLRCLTKVTLFDEIAQQFEEAYKKQMDDTVIVVLASAKIGRYQGELNLSNYPATRFYMNINHPIVNQLRIRCMEPLFYLSNLPKQNDDNYKLMTILQIKQLTEQNNQNKVICQVKVVKIQDELQWFCNVCLNCDVDLENINGKWTCPQPNCKKHYPYPDRRFRVCTLCADNTGGIPIIFEDTEVRCITGKTVFDIELDQTMRADDGKFPPELLTFLNKDYTITLKISERNLRKESDIYQTCDIVEGHELVANNTPMPDSSLEAEDDTTYIETDVGETYPQTETPNTGSSGTTKRVRKSEEAEEDNNEDNLTLNMMKTVKPKKGFEVGMKPRKKKSPDTEKIKTKGKSSK